jgi:hypothetical protein
VKRVASYFGCDLRLIGDQAKEETVKGAVERASYVHFAERRC